MSKLTHRIEKKAVEILVDRIMAERNPADRQKTLKRLSYVMQHLFGDLFEKESFDDARRLIDEGGKWFRFLNTALDTLNPHVVKTAVMDLGFEAGFYGLRTRDAAKAKYHCNIPWAILFDPTSACNLHCIGCWAAEYGHTLNLSFDVMDKIVREGKALGCHFYLLTGGEPLMRKKDILRLCRKHPDCEFHAFTNGTLIDDAFCDEVTDVGNLSFSLSIEGFREVNDSRRGEGDFDKVMHAMDLLRKHGIVFGTSICYTRKNIDTVTSDEFLDLLIKKGVWFTWYFHYMPVGNDASLDLLPTEEQRAYMVRRVREIRSVKGASRFSPSISRTMASSSTAVSLAAAITAISNPMATSNRASSSIIPAPISTTRACSRACSSRSSKNMPKASPSTTTICARVRCWKIRSI